MSDRIVIGIAGGSASGKSTLTQGLTAALQDIPGIRPTTIPAVHYRTEAASNHTAIHDQGERLLSEVGEQSLGNGKKPGLESLTVVLEEASKSGDEAFLVGTMGGSMEAEHSAALGFVLLEAFQHTVELCLLLAKVCNHSSSLNER